MASGISLGWGLISTGMPTDASASITSPWNAATVFGASATERAWPVVVRSSRVSPSRSKPSPSASVP